MPAILSRPLRVKQVLVVWKALNCMRHVNAEKHKKDTFFFLWNELFEKGSYVILTIAVLRYLSSFTIQIPGRIY